MQWQEGPATVAAGRTQLVPSRIAYRNLWWKDAAAAVPGNITSLPSTLVVAYYIARMDKTTKLLIFVAAANILLSMMATIIQCRKRKRGARKGPTTIVVPLNPGTPPSSFPSSTPTLITNANFAEFDGTHQSSPELEKVVLH
uniref:Uncharacterized protein n=1 Tax=Oryza barthii TaxID=65489 RepID=A0A0D3GWV1_9ORYZ